MEGYATDMDSLDRLVMNLERGKLNRIFPVIRYVMDDIVNEIMGDPAARRALDRLFDNHGWLMEWDHAKKLVYFIDVLYLSLIYKADLALVIANVDEVMLRHCGVRGSKDFYLLCALVIPGIKCLAEHPGAGPEYLSRNAGEMLKREDLVKNFAQRPEGLFTIARWILRGSERPKKNYEILAAVLTIIGEYRFLMDRLLVTRLFDVTQYLCMSELIDVDACRRFIQFMMQDQYTRLPVM